MRHFTLAISIAVAVVSCAGPEARRSRPEDMTAEEHRRAAAAQEEIAQRAPFVRRRDSGRWWSYYWDSGNEHLAERDAHLAAAETLETRYRKACGGLPIDTESTSPFERDTLAAIPTDRGVVIQLATEAGAPETVLAAIRCHWSWLQLEPRAGAANDIVAIEGLAYEVVRRDETLEITVIAVDEDSAVELRRRAALAVERDR